MWGTILSRISRAEPSTERRRQPSMPAVDGTVEIDGRTYPLSNWSYTGFLAQSYDGDRQAGEQVDAVVTALLGERQLEFECPVKLIRVDRDSGKLVGAFVKLDPAIKVEIARTLG